MKKAFIATVAIGMAVAGLTLASRKAEDTAPKEAIPVRYVSAEGKVEALPGAEVEVGSEITGRIERFFVKEGDLVKKGGLIAILENRDIKAKLREAETEAAVARARLKETASGAREEEIRRAGASLDGAVADMHLTTAELERYERLHRQGMVSQAELDQKQSAYKIALSRVKEAEEAKTLLEKGPKQETLKVNEVMIKQAEATVEYYKRLLDKTIIKAPISGKVIRKYAQEGELVNLSSAETLLAAIADIEKVRINAEVDETDIGKIKIGDPVDVTSDAYTGKVFKGEIEEIADYVGARNVRPNNPAKNMDMKVVQVKIELKEK
ncbi:MAG TPA: efflux RND transporter periplasmic adaptor subunit, partial [Syntrophales bacterium]|nr:efflux RND transporter periplasmic adaptor subunit [Syntrophales bacterium]